MNAIAHLVFALISLALTGLGGLILGWKETSVIGLAVLLHEIGHARVWIVFGRRPSEVALLVSPWIGLTVPIDQTSDGPLLTPTEEGLLFVGGCLFSLIVILPIWVADTMSAYALTRPHSGVYGSLLFVVLLMNVLNLSVLLPVADGGRLLLLLSSCRHGYGKTVLPACAWAVTGVAATCFMPTWFAVVLIAVSILFFLPTIMPSVEPHLIVNVKGSHIITLLPMTGYVRALPLPVRARVLIARLWGWTFLGSIALLLAHPFLRTAFLWFSGVSRD